MGWIEELEDMKERVRERGRERDREDGMDRRE